MTAAQNTMQWGGTNRLAGFAAAAAIGLAVAVVGVAISARPIVAPASEAAPAAVPAPAPAIRIVPIDPTLQADTHSEALRLKAAEADAAKAALAAATGWPVVSTLTPREELDAQIQAQVQKHELDMLAQQQRVAFGSGGWPVVSTLTPQEQLDAQIQAQIQMHELYVLAQKHLAAGPPAQRLGGPHRG